MDLISNKNSLWKILIGQTLINTIVVCYFVLNMCIFKLCCVHEHNYTSRDDNRMINAVEKVFNINVPNTRKL